MTERLYYTHSYQQDFTATVVAIHMIHEQPAVQLDRTGFYPTSGGQPFDTGQLAGFPVVDVLVDEQGEVQHLLAVPATDAVGKLLMGSIVEGTIDWPRRYDHMQQHSGQHLLSQLFFQECGFETVAVHFGAAESTLDLDTGEVSVAELAAVEHRANELVYAALPIHAYFVDEKMLSTIPLRRPPKVSGTIRIVEIDAFDYSACGGTHCRTSAEIGPVKITKVERRRNQVRVTFLCGLRAFVDYVAKHRLITEAAMLFSNEVQQVPALIERHLSQLRAVEHALEESQTALLVYEAAALAQGAETIDDVRLVHTITEHHSAAMLKTLASHLQTQAGLIALLATSDDEKVTLCFACNIDLVGLHKLNMGQLLRTVLQPIGGKGGGKADFAQGGGIAASQIDAVLASARHQLLTLFHH